MCVTFWRGFYLIFMIDRKKHNYGIMCINNCNLIRLNFRKIEFGV